MLDEEKIKLMTKVTIYEQNEEFDGLAMSNFYKEDYVKYGCLKTLIVATFAYWLTVAVYILLKFEKIMADLNHVDYFKLISRLMVGYVIVMVVFYIYAFIVYNYKYAKARPGLVKYNRMLRKLIKLYEKEDAHSDVLKGRVKVYSSIGGDFDELDEEMPVERSEDSAGDNQREE